MFIYKNGNVDSSNKLLNKNRNLINKKQPDMKGRYETV